MEYIYISLHISRLQTPDLRYPMYFKATKQNLASISQFLSIQVIMTCSKHQIHIVGCYKSETRSIEQYKQKKMYFTCIEHQLFRILPLTRISIISITPDCQTQTNCKLLLTSIGRHHCYTKCRNKIPCSQKLDCTSHLSSTHSIVNEGLHCLRRAEIEILVAC